MIQYLITVIYVNMIGVDIGSEMFNGRVGY